MNYDLMYIYHFPRLVACMFLQVPGLLLISSLSQPIFLKSPLLDKNWNKSRGFHPAGHQLRWEESPSTHPFIWWKRDGQFGNFLAIYHSWALNRTLRLFRWFRWSTDNGSYFLRWVNALNGKLLRLQWINGKGTYTLLHKSSQMSR